MPNLRKRKETAVNTKVLLYVMLPKEHHMLSIVCSNVPPDVKSTGLLT